MVYICREESFCAAHKLYNPQWSKSKNEEVFGPCANENWHGHNFKLTVKVKGIPNKETGYVMDLKILGNIIKEHILEKVDHKNLNLDVPFLKDKMPTCEVVVMEFWNILAPIIFKTTNGHAALHCILLRETDKNSVEYFGE